LEGIIMSWEAVGVRGTPPCGRYGHTASVVGRKIFVFGGFDGNSQLNDVHVLDQKEVNEGARLACICSPPPVCI
jgi:hypothetical protein